MLMPFSVARLLSAAYMDSLENETSSEFGGSRVTYILKEIDDSITNSTIIDFIWEPDLSHIIVKRNDEDRVIKKAAADYFDFDSLEQLALKVLQNKSDPEHCALVNVPSIGLEANASKEGTARAINLMDDKIVEDIVINEAFSDYDIFILAKGISYSINSKNGNFERKYNGELKYGTLDANRLRHVQAALEIPAL